MPARQQIGDTAQSQILDRFGWLNKQRSQDLDDAQAALIRKHESAEKERTNLLDTIKDDVGTRVDSVQSLVSNKSTALEKSLQSLEQTTKDQSVDSLNKLEDTLSNNLTEVIETLKEMTPTALHTQLGRVQGACLAAIETCDAIDQKLLELADTKKQSTRNKLIDDTQALALQLRGALGRIQKASSATGTEPAGEEDGAGTDKPHTPKDDP